MGDNFLRKAHRTLNEDGVFAFLRSAVSPNFRRRLKEGKSAKWLDDYQKMLRSGDPRHRFEQMYLQGLWSRIANISETRSGGGSTLKSTSVFRKELEAFLRNEQPGTFFDAPCGDFNFMRKVHFPDGWDYLGGDIAPSVIKHVRQKYPQRSFLEIDLTTDRFPMCDIWLCRACLFHLSFSDIRNVLTNFANSNARLALINSDIDVEKNCNIVTGDYRPLDLTLPPFSFPTPSRFLNDKPHGQSPCIVGIWRREEIGGAILA
jgi:hypothetical protein